MRIPSYRITKYDPVYRSKEGWYTKDEWTGYSDVGSFYDGKVFTQEEYEKIETHYLNVIKEIYQKTSQKYAIIRRLENYKRLNWKNNQKLDLAEVEKFSKDCLREQCWGKVHGRKFFVHFGYDYYMFIGTDLPKAEVEKIVADNNLFCEEYPSPHRF